MPDCGRHCTPSNATPARGWCSSRPNGSAGRRPGATAGSSRPASPTGRRTESRAGRTEFDRLEELGLANLDGMQADIESHGMKVDWERTGMLSVATEAHQVEWLREAADEGHGRFLDEAAVRAEVASPTYRAGLFAAETCAIVHPARLVFELARAAVGSRCADLRAHPRAVGRPRPRRCAGEHPRRRDQRRPGCVGHQRLSESAAAQPALHRPGVRLCAGHRAAHRRPAGPHRLALPAGHRRQLQPVPLLPAVRRQPDRVGRIRRGLPLRPARRRDVRGPAGDLPPAGRALLHHLPATRRRPVHPPLGRRRSTPTPDSVRTGDWPAGAASPTSTASPAWASAPRGSPPTSAWTCSAGIRPSAPSWRW